MRWTATSTSRSKHTCRNARVAGRKSTPIERWRLHWATRLRCFRRVCGRASPSRLPAAPTKEHPPMPLLVRDGGTERRGGRTFRPRPPIRLGPHPPRFCAQSIGHRGLSARGGGRRRGHRLGRESDPRRSSNLESPTQRSGQARIPPSWRRFDTAGRKIVDVETAGHRQLAEFVVVPDGEGYLVKSNLPALSSNKTYQLWGVIDRAQPSRSGFSGQSPDQVTFTSWPDPRPDGIGHHRRAGRGLGGAYRLDARHGDGLTRSVRFRSHV